MIRKSLITTLAIAVAGPAFAAEPDDCRQVVFSDVGWSDITATTALASTVLQALGYETETKLLSVPVTYTALSTDDVDVFLGNWMPTMEADIAPYRDAGTVDTVRTNLTGAKYTLATNKAGADLGITDGMVKSNALVFDTEDTNVTGEASANLKTEQFDIEMLAHPKDPSPLSARTPVGAEGTFADPQVTVDPTAAVARGAAAVALGVLLTPLAALIPLIEPGDGQDSPCGQLLRQAGQN